MTLSRSTLPLFLLTLGAGAVLLSSSARGAPEPVSPKVPLPAKPASTPKDAVRWNQDLTAARARANELGRPLLVFQLLGSLDQEFC